MGDLTRNLSRHEYACRCGCGLAEPHPRLVIATQRVVNRCRARAVIVTSGSRCNAYQRELVRRNLTATLEGWHQPREELALYTAAADYIFRGVKLADALAAAEVEPDFAVGGIGLYIDKYPRLHLDVRGRRARWALVDGITTTYEQARVVMLARGV